MIARPNPLRGTCRWLPAALTIALSTSALHAAWRSTLYPADWKPGFADGDGRFLHDFSYAGYHRGESELPQRQGAVIDATKPPHSADPSGAGDSTQAIQSALDAAAAAGGGIVFLPAGTYRIAPPKDKPVALRIEGDNIVLRGAGPDKTFLFLDEPVMREKIGIEVKSREPSWWYAEGKWVVMSLLSRDLPGGSTVIPVENPALFAAGDPVVVRNDLTESFIASLGMTGKWTQANMKNRSLLFSRRIVAVDSGAGTVTIDIPTRYDLKKGDNARVSKPGGHMITEAGLEDFSFGMRQHPGTGLEDDDYNKPGTIGYDVHQSHAIVFTSAENCWMRRVNSFCPKGNAPDVHVLSNAVKFEKSRLVTAEDCDWKNTQYKGGGGNGYLYTLHGNDCLIRNCRADNGRHNYDIATMCCSGNVLLDCRTKDARLASDFHMYFAVANLIDNMTCDGDFLEAKFRPYGGTPVHGVTTSQSVFWNTNGLRYPSSPFEYLGKMYNRPQIVVESAQFGDGYIIGTRGPAHAVKTTNFKEGIGEGDSLEPRSLYADQLARRLKKN